MSPLRVHLANSDNFSRVGISGALAQAEDLILEKAYSSIVEAVEGTLEHQPDIVLVEDTVRGENLGQAISEITTSSPKTKVVILAVTHDTGSISRTHAAGSSGYITKDTIHAELPSALRMIAGGYSVFAQPSDEEIFPPRARLMADRNYIFKSLSQRDRQLISLVAAGNTNSRIARVMHISEGTVKLYLARIMEKLKIANRIQLAVIAAEVGLITFEDLEFV